MNHDHINYGETNYIYIYGLSNHGQFNNSWFNLNKFNHDN